MSHFVTISVTTRDTMAEDTESLRLEMLDEASLTRQPDEVTLLFFETNFNVSLGV